MNSGVIMFSGIVAFVLVLVINFFLDICFKGKKKLMTEMCETVELNLLRFPVDIGEIYEFSKTHREKALKAVVMQIKMLNITEQMMNEIPFLRKNHDIRYAHLNKLLLNAKQCIKNLEQQLELQNKPKENKPCC